MKQVPALLVSALLGLFDLRWPELASVRRIVFPPVTKLMPAKMVMRPAQSPAAVGPSHHAARVGDRRISAGQIPLDPATGHLGPGGIQAQTRACWRISSPCLMNQKLPFDHVVKTTVFLTNLGDFAAMNEVSARCCTGDFPARSTVQVAALPRGSCRWCHRLHDRANTAA